MKRIAIILDDQVSEIREVADDSVLAPNAVNAITDPIPAFSSATHKVVPGRPELVKDPQLHVRETWEVVERTSDERAASEERDKDEMDRSALKTVVLKLEEGTATNREAQSALARVIRLLARSGGAVLLWLLLAVTTFADDLIWDDTNPPGKVKSFKIWQETDLGAWTNIATVSTNRWTIVLPAGVHRLAVSAVGAGTNEVSSPMSSPPTLLTVFIVPVNVRVEK